MISEHRNEHLVHWFPADPAGESDVSPELPGHVSVRRGVVG